MSVNDLLKNQLASIQHLCRCQGVQLIGKNLLGFDQPYVGTHIDAEKELTIINERELSFELEFQSCLVAFYVISSKVLFITVSSKNAHVFSIEDDRRRSTPNGDTSQHSKEHHSEGFILLFESQIEPWMLAFETIQCVDEASHLQTSFLSLLYSSFHAIPILISHQAISTDPISLLNSRAAFLQDVKTLTHDSSVALCLIKCNEFTQIKLSLEDHVSDHLLSEMAGYISQITRSYDHISRFAGATFAVASPLDEQKQAEFVSNKITQYLSQQTYVSLAGSKLAQIPLSFNVGIAYLAETDPCNDDIDKATVLFTRAEQALNAAASSDTPSTVIWDRIRFALNDEQFSYLGGIFTSDTIGNYRNMLLLWDISSIIADEYLFDKLLNSVAQRLIKTFEFDALGVWSIHQHVNEFDSMCFAINEHDSASKIDKNELSFISLMPSESYKSDESTRIKEILIGEHILYLMPLEDDPARYFFFYAHRAKFVLTDDAKALLSGIVKQIEKALRRCQLEADLNNRLTHQNQQLEAEVQTLKQGLSSTTLIYKSPLMEQVVKQTKRAAVADTTILVTGESGTGKERLIHAIHKLGPRANKPLVIVDCGSIPETLIESELFGYVKGAFTGAQKSSVGKVEEADGGILVLDEIGELPLVMQPKLLRFVQEKHYTPVGGVKVRKVDVKIVAVTNRNLEEEVQLGTFRKDLYYRLNVVTLNNPPLRERQGDVELLAQHFLNKFAKQFDTNKKFLSDTAIQAMQQYSWPGNIRELENKLMQAVLLSEGDEISSDQLKLDADDMSASKLSDSKLLSEGPVTVFELQSHASVQATHPIIQEHAPVLPHESTLGRSYTSSPVNLSNHSVNPPDILSAEQLLDEISNAVASIVQEISNTPRFLHFCIGDLVEVELLLLCYQAVDGNIRTLSSRLGVPASTARRRINKLVMNITDNNPVERPAAWKVLSKYLQMVADGKVIVHEPFASIKRAMLTGILLNNPPNMSKVADMMGVSEPTLYKIKKQIGLL